jgi:hypothetical protein
VATLPTFQRSRGISTLDIATLARMEESVATYATALTDERRGLLAHGLTFRDNLKGCVLELSGVVAPDDWRDIDTALMLNSWQLYPTNASPSAVFRLALRKEADGMVEVRGLAKPPTPSSMGDVFSWPTGCIPLRTEVVGPHGEGGWVEIRTASTGPTVVSRASTAQPEGWVSFSGVRFAATNRAPLDWPTASQVTAILPDAFPGEAGQVLVLDAVDESSGLHTAGAHAIWGTTTVGGKPALLFSRFDGLTVGRTYSLVLAVLSA